MFQTTVIFPGRSPVSERPIGGVAKRAFDATAAGAALLFLLPIFALIALAIKAFDPGPVFFSHSRVGFGHRSFGCLKFRTMVVNSAEVLEEILRTDPAARREWNETQKLRNDPRISRLGRFLRQTSLDELPQLINVLRGEMSLVGPRPIVEAEIRRYGGDFTYYAATRPGITGAWQVGGRSDCSYEERVAFDAGYVSGWSFFKDIAILFRTVGVVVSGKGSC